MASVWVICHSKSHRPLHAYASKEDGRAVADLLKASGGKAELVEVSLNPGISAAAVPSIVPGFSIIPTPKPVCEHDWVDDVCQKCGEKL